MKNNGTSPGKIWLVFALSPMIAWFITILYAMFAPDSILDENILFEYLTILALLFGLITISAIGAVNKNDRSE